VATNYRIRAFAERAGVTVKALHHYDRVGLLKPRRTGAGYRVYTDGDLLRLQQVVALKFLGLPLEQIRRVLDDGVLPLAEALALQHAALCRRRGQIDRALAAIKSAQQAMAAEPSPGANVLTRLIEELAMPDIDELKQYFSEEAWVRWRARHATWPSAEWKALYAEVQASLDENVASDHAQALAKRCVALFEAEIGNDPAIRTGMRRATNDHERWRAFIQAAMPDIDVERVSRFLVGAAWAKWDAPDGRTYDTPTVRPKASRARTTLMHDLAAAVDDDPRGARVRRLMARWDALTDEESGGDPAMRTQIERGAASWRNWPEGMQRWVAATVDMPVDTWKRVMELVAASESSIRADS
jgi:DNA-binding transcriptional MerR regulator